MTQWIYFFKLLSAFSNYNSSRVLFDKNCFRIFYLKKICLYFSTGDDQPMEPALCQLYRHTFVPCTGTAIVSPRLSVAPLPLRAPSSAKRQLPARSGRADGLSWVRASGDSDDARGSSGSRAARLHTLHDQLAQFTIVTRVVRTITLAPRHATTKMSPIYIRRRRRRRAVLPHWAVSHCIYAPLPVRSHISLTGFMVY